MTTTNKTPKEEPQNSITTETAPPPKKLFPHRFANDTECLLFNLKRLKERSGRSWSGEILDLVKSPAATESILKDIVGGSYHVYIRRAALRNPNVTEAVLIEAAQWSYRLNRKEVETPQIILNHPLCTPKVIAKLYVNTGLWARGYIEAEIMCDPLVALQVAAHGESEEGFPSISDIILNPSYRDSR